MFYTSFVRPILEYCPTICGVTTKFNLRKLELTQNKALRIINNRKKLIQTRTDNNIPSFQSRLQYLVLMRIYKAFHEKPDNRYPAMFQKVQSNKSLRSVANNNITVPKVNKETRGKRSFNYVSAHRWNALPASLKIQKSKTKFKNLVKSVVYEFQTLL